jgi:hypothetical protein
MKDIGPIRWCRRKFGRPRMKSFADLENDLQELKMKANSRELYEPSLRKNLEFHPQSHC